MPDNIYLSDEHEMLQEQIRRFITSEIEPHGGEWERAGATPRHVIKAIGGLGLLGVRYPTKYGGSNLDTIASVVLAEELGRSTYGGFAISVLVHTDMASPHLANAGDDAQKDAFMPGVVTGDLLTAVAVTEPDAGSDVAELRTRARRDGDCWVLNGSKMFITNGVCADLYFVAAKTDPTAHGSHGLSIFIVEKDTPGFSVARPLQKFGWRSSDTAELVFDDCRIPAANLLGEENKGFYAIMQNFQNERIVLSAQAMGEAQKAIDLTLDYTRQRRAFGGPLWDREAIRQRLALRQAEVLAGRQMLYHVAWLDAQGRRCIKEVSLLKAYCGELVNKVLYDCQQFHGGAGYVQDSAIERMARDARIHSIGGGATEVMLNEAAKRM